MSALRASYTTVKRDGIIRYYRGAVRAERATVIWECSHEHRYGHRAALRCAEDHLAAEQVSQEGER
jgi:RNase P/RNase MRP subunit POP5